MLKKYILCFLVVTGVLLYTACTPQQESPKEQDTNQKTEEDQESSSKADTKTDETDTSDEKTADTDTGGPQVTFIELGSVDCVPCKMMVPVMEEIEETYGEQVQVVFYDVWTPEGKPYAQEYGIRAIPTQVFLDKDGNEYFRHEGFFPFEQVDEVLKQGGVE